MNLFETIRDSFRPVLSDRVIKKYMKDGLLIENNISDVQFQPNSIDLTLGNTWSKITHNRVDKYTDPVYLTGRDSIILEKECIDVHKAINYETGLFNTDDQGNEYYYLAPGEFILMASKEILNIPNGILSFVQGRSSIARLGIQTEQAGLIDAGFRGTITFEVFNQTEYPIYLYTGMRIAQVYFFKAQYANQIYGFDKGSKYYNQMMATGSLINQDK